MRGEDGLTGIGGVLRDSEGRFRALFFGPAKAEDINGAELLAILQALLLSKDKDRVWGTNLVIESDSSNATCWSNRKKEVNGECNRC